LHGVLGVVVLGHVQTHAALVGLQEGHDGPVLGVRLRPDHAPVLQLGQGLQEVRAGFDRPQILAAHAGQVEHRHAVGWQSDIGRLARESRSAAKWPGQPVLGRVVAQHQQFRQLALQARDHGLPLAVLVGPQDARWRNLNLGVEDRRVAQGL
jgi:hypothetical protein